jgi:hypothetical protein
MDQGPLVNEQVDAGAALVREFDKYKPLQSAFWLKESDDGDWYLYLASDQIDDSNSHEAYKEVYRLVAPGPQVWLDAIQVKVRGVDDPVVKSVIEIQKKYPARLATRVRNRLLGGLSIDEAYIYPLPIAASS